MSVCSLSLDGQTQRLERTTAVLRMAATAVAIVLLCSGPSTAQGDDEDQPVKVIPAEDGGETYDLAYKFREGELVRSKLVHLVTVETTIAGSSQTAQTVSGSVRQWRVTNVHEGEYTFENMVESVDMKQRMSGRQEVRYNSLKDEKAPPGYEDVAKMLGKTLSTITVDAAGKVIDREDEISQPTAYNTSNQILFPLPSEPVGVGAIWTVPQEIPVSLEGKSTKRVKTRQRFELEKVSDGVATIAIETQVVSAVEDPKIRVQLVQRLSKGHMKFDIEAGRMISAQTDLDEQVIGFSGPDSSMRYVARFTEESLTGEPTKTAAKSVTKKRRPPK